MEKRIQGGMPMAAAIARAFAMRQSADAIVVAKVQVRASPKPFFGRFLLAVLKNV